MSNENKEVLCPYEDERVDCFARRSWDGHAENSCRVLSKTDFKHHDCPFYKSYEDFKKGLAVYGGLKPY